MSRKLEQWMASAALTAVLFAMGCAGEGIGSAGTGRLTVRLTDAPFPLDQVERADIHVVRIDAKLSETDESEAGESTGEGSNNDPSRGWVTIASPDQSYNLLELQGGNTVDLGDETLPTGTYHGFRLILNTDLSTITLTDGTVLDGNGNPGIKWPSAGRTGIKIVLEEPIEVGEGETVVVVDFDLAKSFVMRGNSLEKNGLLFKPVIRGVVPDLTGSVSGVVRQDSETGAVVADATVEVVKPGTAVMDTDPANVIATTKSEDDGTYRLAFLLPGAYSLRAIPPSTLATHNPVLIEDLEVTAGGDLDGQILVLPRK